MIDVIKKVPICGMLQKIHIRGIDAKQPVLLVLHGGPGIPNRASFFKHHSDLCSHFLVVTWDQRGCGGSYKGIDPSTLTLAQYINDAKALIEYLCESLKCQKLFILCGSWGTELGTMLAFRYPEHIAGYVGFGQTVNGIENERVSYEFALKGATEANDAKSVALLNECGPPVDGQYKGGFKGLTTQRKVLKKYGGNSTRSGGWFKTMALPILFSREYTLGDKIGIFKGYSLVLSTMWKEITNYNFIEQCYEFEMPYYIFQGKLDYNTPAELIPAFYEKIKAPEKDLIWFENSAHGPLNEEPEKFKALLIKKLLG
ncbi:MAG: alpha/beta hydrolase [Christensenellaceae bacterium]|jgi:pimeloyl-ACP methyl ester carboxylesterase|nr:alpha/beta hydrolase [Christensenellaceae bacterium]